MRALDDFMRFYTQGNSMVRKLIIVNALVFLLSSIMGLIFWSIEGTEAFPVLMDKFNRYFSVPANLSTLIIRPWTVITYAFFHVSIGHIFFNMLFMYWLGSIFQEYLGNRKVLSTYIWGSLFGAALYVVAFNALPVLSPYVQDSHLLGASAGVMALVVGIATFIPYYEISIFRFFVQLRWIAIGFIIFDFAMMPQSNAGGHIAHLGGALFGFLYARHLRRNTKFGYGIEGVGDFIGGLFKKKPKSKLTVVKRETTVYSSTTVADFDDDYEPSPEVIDAILDKINQSGYESLTRKERDLLFKASKQD